MALNYDKFADDTGERFADMKASDERYNDVVKDVIGHASSELGMTTKKFKQNVRALAYAAPAGYVALKDAYESFLQNLVIEIHGRIFKFLTTGTHGNATIPHTVVGLPEPEKYIPRYSVAEAKRMALGVASSMYKVVEEEFLDDVFPESLLEEALARARQVR